MQCVNGSASQTSWTDQLYRSAVQTSWMDQQDRPGGWTSSFYILFIFEDFPFSLYIVAASESDEGLVYGHSPIITLCIVYTRYQTEVLSYDNIVYRTDKISDGSVVI